MGSYVHPLIGRSYDEARKPRVASATGSKWWAKEDPAEMALHWLKQGAQAASGRPERRVRRYAGLHDHVVKCDN
jgi:hypothetical protein